MTSKQEIENAVINYVEKINLSKYEKHHDRRCYCYVRETLKRRLTSERWMSLTFLLNTYCLYKNYLRSILILGAYIMIWLGLLRAAISLKANSSGASEGLYLLRRLSVPSTLLAWTENI